MLKLHETQKLIWKLITAPLGVEQALAEDPSIALPIKGDLRLSAVERLSIYANMYFFRIRDILKEDFPAVHRALGEEGFHQLITDYLLAHPSTHWSLRYAGRDLPAFAAGHAFGESHPFLSELAGFEWRVLEAFDAPGADVLTKEKLARLKPEEWGAVELQLVPSCSRLACHWNVDQLHQSFVGKKRRKRSPEKFDHAVIFWRRELEVRHRRVEADEGMMLEQLAKGTTFGEICEVASQQFGDEAGLAKASSFLAGWLEAQLLQDI